LPEVWHPEDSLKILLLQSFDQTRRSFENQLREEQWLEKNPKTDLKTKKTISPLRSNDLKKQKK
jgi:phage terminase large subunit-like protein